MPLGNDKDKDWHGWLVDGLGGREKEYAAALAEAIESRNIPKCSVNSGTLNMWWRRDSLYIDATSELDGKFVTTIHVQEYGMALWVGRAAEGSSQWSQWNYYKRMAGSAFLTTIDRCIVETFLTMVDKDSVKEVPQALSER